MPPTRAFKVVFQPDGDEALAPSGATLLAAASMAHVAIDAPCGDRGVCGKCRVQASGDLEPPTPSERTLIQPEELAQGWRLACQARAAGDVTVSVPERALKMAVVPLSTIELRPHVRKLFLSVPRPTVVDPASDTDRLRRCLTTTVPDLQVSLKAARQLPRVVGRGAGGVTVVLAGNRLLALEAGDTTASCYGIAVDLGTTSVVVILANLASGEVLGIESMLNGQANYGADVISRVEYSATPAGLQTLQQAAVDTINSALRRLAERTGVDPEQVYEAVVVGNSCMNHLLLGIEPASLARAPYQPTLSESVQVPATDVGLSINPSGQVYTLPNIAGFVGSDTVAVILATAMHRSEELQLALDLGTNGEMVLGDKDRLLACSTAAGPAFEGARISCGMRATKGAIERVWIDEGQVRIQVVGNGAPIGLCGSGLMDAVAQMRAAGLMDQSGRIILPDQRDAGIPPRLAERLDAEDGTRGFTLYRRGRRRLVLGQADVRELQLAKGAIRAGIAVLMEEYGVDAAAVDQVLLAGAFGSYLSPASARAIGLIPPVPLNRIAAVGNAAGQGALMALLSTDLREQANEIARSVEYVELASRRDFMRLFLSAMALDPLRLA